MRLYNNDPTTSLDDEDEHSHLARFFSELKEKRKFIVRDLYSFGCPRVGGKMNNTSWALQYKTALDNHMGKSWRMVNKYDPVTAVPPVVPLISTWNHVDNGYQVSDKNPPEPLPSEIGTQPGISLKPWNFPYHGEFASLLSMIFALIDVSHLKLAATGKYFQNLYNASKPGSSITVEWVEEVPDEATWNELAAEAEVLLQE